MELKREIYKIMLSKTFGPKDSGLTYRQLVNWTHKGLLTKKPQGWHKFSLLDLIEIKILNELRAMGLPLKKLKEVKILLEEASDELEALVGKAEFDLTLLLRGVVSTLQGTNTFLVISRNADYVNILQDTLLAEVLSDVGHTGVEHFGEKGNSIVVISFRLLLDEISIDYDKKTYNFRQLMNAILDGTFSNLDLSMDGDFIRSIQATMDIESDQKYSDVNLRKLVDAKNQKVEIHTGNDGIRQIRTKRKL